MSQSCKVVIRTGRSRAEGGGGRKQTHLGLGDDLLFARVRVSAVDDADHVRLRALHQRDRCPEDTFPATACVAVRSRELASMLHQLHTV